jgi:hypothetical protein
MIHPDSHHALSHSRSFRYFYLLLRLARKYLTWIGAIGRQFCDLALKEGHKLTLFVRNATKVPGDIRNKATHVIEGSLEVESDLDEIARCGADMFVSFAGPAVGASGTV